MQFDYHAKICTDLEYQTDKSLTATQDVEKAKPELCGMSEPGCHWPQQYGKEWKSSTWFISHSGSLTLPTTCSPPRLHQTQMIPLCHPSVIPMGRRRSLAAPGTICLPSNSSCCREPINPCTASSRLPQSTLFSLGLAGIWKQKGPSVTGRVRQQQRKQKDCRERDEGGPHLQPSPGNCAV